jgi:hypothetical protein
MAVEEKIARLQEGLARQPRKMSAEERARIAVAQKKRWAMKK